jgi:hypothetical protein
MEVRTARDDERKGTQGKPRDRPAFGWGCRRRFRLADRTVGGFLAGFAGARSHAGQVHGTQSSRAFPVHADSVSTVCRRSRWNAVARRLRPQRPSGSPTPPDVRQREREPIASSAFSISGQLKNAMRQNGHNDVLRYAAAQRCTGKPDRARRRGQRRSPRAASPRPVLHPASTSANFPAWLGRRARSARSTPPRHSAQARCGSARRGCPSSCP